jgi:hypothetical protein
MANPHCASEWCNEPKDHIHLSEQDVNAYKQMHEAAQISHAGTEIERTRAVQTHEHADLLDHLQSNNGHIMGRYAQYRNTHDDEHIPGVRPIDPNYDHELTHRELIALHQHDHNKYPEEGHTTMDGEHFHH